MSRPPAPTDPWSDLARLTPARIALGRTGASLPTGRVLAFSLAHAQARDAVLLPLDAGAVMADIEALGVEVRCAHSAAPDRGAYLNRPDLGRRLGADSRERLQTWAEAPFDLAIVVADGLSSTAVQRHAAPMIAALLPGFAAQGWRLAPIVVATQARVAIGDEIGELAGARLVVLLVGERPGLSSPDSLGAYLTFQPRPGLTDAQRNCVSNIHGGGLSFEAAAGKILWLTREALRLGLTGVDLKDSSDDDRLVTAAPARLD